MSWLGNVAARTQVAAGHAALSRRLRKLERVFEVDRMRAQAPGAREVVEYYEQSAHAYRRFHSTEGAVHMALNPDGRFDAAGFYGQLVRLEQAWAARPPAAVLELAFGQGFNLAHLASRLPHAAFAGIDLTPTHCALAQARLREAGLGNEQLVRGDFHALPFAAASFDELFCIEAFCHATDMPLALAEAARVLRPGGHFTLFDGYLPRSPGAMEADEALAVDLVAKSLAVPGLQVLGELLDASRAAGFDVAAVADLDTQVLPNLARLETLTGAIIRVPWLGRRALAKRPAARSANVVAGYLMRSTVSLGLIGYREIVLTKRAA